jgi:Tol biopolymer transport system component
MIAKALSVNPVFAQKKGGKPSPTSPSLQNAEIVYVSADSIKVADADGSNQVTLITNRFAHFGAPSWAPDGDKIIFSSNISGEGIYEISINRSNGQIGPPESLLEHNAGILGSPRWSPVATVNGKFMIAYEHYPPGSNETDIYLLDATTGVSFNLTNTPTISELTASWSPDASKVAVISSSSHRDVEILQLEACVNQPICVSARRSLIWEVAGSLLFGATSLEPSSGLLRTSWANEGNKIAVSALMPPDQNSDIWLIELDDSGVVLETRNLTNTNTVNPPDRHETVPTWSPDDSQIMYMGWDYLCQPQSNRKRGYNLIIRNVDGSDIDNCEEKMIVEGGGYPGASSPNWWRGPNSVSP